MAVNPLPLPEFAAVDGIRLGVAQAGIKAPGRSDLVVMELCEGSTVGAVFTRNAFCAAPVLIAQRHLSEASPRYLLINTGNANAGNGEQGMTDARSCCEALARECNVPEQAVLPFSTGVIGEPLPVERIVTALPQALTNLRGDAWADAANGILTTDTLPKGSMRQIAVDGQSIRICGISKGAGMIRPNMATMLGFIGTDARIAQPLLQRLVSELAESSFNRITVDGDTSTNDACVVVATGRSAAPEITEGSPGWQDFREALAEVFLELAQAIVRDAEGATKFVAVRVRGAADGESALRTAFTVAESPLVKTALYASDPNWGRILAAVGRAGVPSLDVSRVRIDLDDVCIVSGGGRDPAYTEEKGQAVMDRAELTVTIDLGMGDCAETVWTSDFSHEYVTINAEYRT